MGNVFMDGPGGCHHCPATVRVERLPGGQPGWHMRICHSRWCDTIGNEYTTTVDVSQLQTMLDNTRADTPSAYHPAPPPTPDPDFWDDEQTSQFPMLARLIGHKPASL